jgi:hypothetical protein
VADVGEAVLAGELVRPAFHGGTFDLDGGVAVAADQVVVRGAAATVEPFAGGQPHGVDLAGSASSCTARETVVRPTLVPRIGGGAVAQVVRTHRWKATVDDELFELVGDGLRMPGPAIVGSDEEQTGLDPGPAGPLPPDRFISWQAMSMSTVVGRPSPVGYARRAAVTVAAVTDEAMIDLDDRDRARAIGPSGGTASASHHGI